MNVSADDSAALPARMRPTVAEVGDWYERILRASRIEVDRASAGLIEFQVPFGATYWDFSLGDLLGPVSRGRVEINETADGFEVSAEAVPRAWVTFVPLFVFGALAAPFGLVSGPVRYVTTFGVLGLTVLSWLRARSALRAFVEKTDQAVVASYSARPRGAPDGRGLDARGAARGEPAGKDAESREEQHHEAEEENVVRLGLRRFFPQQRPDPPRAR
jgi:hypothetical protein